MNDGAPVLKVDNLCVESNGKAVVEQMSLDVKAGEIVALVGPNGAGKSELVLAIAGVLPKSSGSVLVAGKEVAGLKPDRIRLAGLAAVPEGHQVLPGLSVIDNLRAAGSMLDDAGLHTSVREACDLFPELDRLLPNRAGLLSGGQQQMVALAQALVGRPTVLLIDEMSLGLAPVIIERLLEAVPKLAARGVGVLLIEQYTHLALELADRAIVMYRGRLRFSGAARELRDKPEILRSIYFGQ